VVGSKSISIAAETHYTTKTNTQQKLRRRVMGIKSISIAVETHCAKKTHNTEPTNNSGKEQTMETNSISMAYNTYRVVHEEQNNGTNAADIKCKKQ
jgi:hypothetical protein